jgi:Tfp pilus assembly protein PilN
MAQSINLIPQQEKEEQVQVKLVKTSTIFAIILLVIIGGVAGYFFLRTTNLKSELKSEQDRVESLRSEIKGLSSIEIVARNLDTIQKTLEGIFSNKLYYSMLLEELKRRVPDSISVESFTLNSGSTINVSGGADNYLSIAKFINDLTNEKFGGVENITGLFTSVALNSVSLESRSNRANFFINVNFDANKLKRVKITTSILPVNIPAPQGGGQ